MWDPTKSPWTAVWIAAIIIAFTLFAALKVAVLLIAMFGNR
jgi:hypothetical protein